MVLLHSGCNAVRNGKTRACTPTVRNAGTAASDLALREGFPLRKVSRPVVRTADAPVAGARGPRPKERNPIGVRNPCRYVTVSGKVPPQAVTSRYVGRREGFGILVRIARSGHGIDDAERDVPARFVVHPNDRIRAIRRSEMLADRMCRHASFSDFPRRTAKIEG